MSIRMSTPSWYDLLGVDPTASTAEVRAAWKVAVADLDPTDRRFRAYNQAAEVLLDPDRRAAYDAERRPDPEPDPEPDLAPAEASDVTVTRAGTRVPGWLLALVGVLAALAVATAAWLWFVVPADSEVEDATRAARAAAETAVVPILSYDAADLEASRASATSYLTSDYRAEYEKFFEGVMEKNAPRTGTVVETSVVRSGVVRAGEDRVEVFVLLDQATTNARRAQPSTIKYWVTVTMERTDEEWLVAGLKTRA